MPHPVSTGTSARHHVETEWLLRTDRIDFCGLHEILCGWRRSLGLQCGLDPLLNHPLLRPEHGFKFVDSESPLRIAS